MRQLTKAGFKKVFREVASGAKTDRVQLRRLLDQLGAGDVVTVTRFQRYSESLTGRHSLARLRVLQCCSVAVIQRGRGDLSGLGVPPGSGTPPVPAPHRPSSSADNTMDRCAKAATSVQDRFGDQAYAECFWQ